MIIDRAEHSRYTSNSYLVAEGPGGAGVLVDGHGEGAPLIERIEREDIAIERILLTHHHGDHADVGEYVERFRVPVVAHPSTAELVGGGLVGESVTDGEEVRAGSLVLRAVHTPGHTLGHLAFLVGEEDLLTGDLLFRGTVAGTTAPGASGYADLRRSIMDVVMGLEGRDRIRAHPGHTLPTTLADEWERNPFVRIWRGLDPEGSERCRVRGREATLVLWAPDYDGTNKAWVRFEDGEDAIVGGSQVERG